MKQNTSYYTAFQTKDSRFDGKFFIGISSTKIYCRPICKAKLAKEENCTFFKTSALAESSGYRPCLLCRPEIAPDSIDYLADSNVALKAAELIQEDFNYNQTIEDIAMKLGCSSRHLRRVFKEEFGVTVSQYIQTQRLLFAKQLLSETSLKVIDIAMISGFGSLRRFNDVFKTHYHLSPSKLRKQIEDNSKSDSIQLLLTYRPPYRYQEILDFLDLRSIQGVELIKDNVYHRTVSLHNTKGEEVNGWIKVSHIPTKNALQLSVSESLLPVLPTIISKTKHLFDLRSDPSKIYAGLQSMNEIKDNLCINGMRLPGCFDSFEIVIRAVLGQQITVKAARTITNRIIQTYGQKIDTGIDGLTHSFPSPTTILSLGEPLSNHLGPLGVIATRCQTIHELAVAFIEKTLQLNNYGYPEDQKEKLQQIKGIGHWTAGYIVMRAMQWPDVFLETDAAIKNAFPGKTPKELLELSNAWSPWRSYAVINIWNSLP